MTKAVTSWQNGGIWLKNFNDTSVLSLIWPGGNALVFGKFLYFSDDGDRQQVQVWLSHGYPQRNVMDYAEMYPEGYAQKFITVSGWVYNMPAGEVIEMRCATYNGAAEDGRLVAILVDDLAGSPLTIPAAQPDASPAPFDRWLGRVRGE